MSPYFFSYFKLREILPFLVLVACFVGLWYAPRFGNGILSSIENFGARLAGHRCLAVLVIVLLPLALRLCLLWLIPIRVLAL